MTAFRSFIQRHPVLTYFVLTFVISWGGVAMLVGFGPGETTETAWQSDPMLPFMGMAMLAGPSVAGLLLIGLVRGREGFQDLLTRLTRWRVGARWYAVALLTAPTLFLAVSLALAQIAPEFLPIVFTADNKIALLLSAVMAAIMVGILEELGWTGFAVPELRLRHGILATGLIVGVVWGAWHILTNGIWASGYTSGDVSMGVFLPLTIVGLLVGQLPAYRVLMVWVYDRTDGSLLVAMLMHASLSACTFILGTATTGAAMLIYSFGLAAAWWIVVVVVYAASGWRLTRRAPQKQMA